MKQSLTPWLSPEEIAAAVGRLAAELDRDYRGRSPALVGVLNGGFIFTADLVRQMHTGIRRVEFVKAASYGSGQTSSGKARIEKGLPAEAVRGQHVVIVEDIVDTGITTAAVRRYLGRHRPASLEICALLDKPSRRVTEVPIKYVGVSIPDRFVVGYGMDLDHRFRELPGIYEVSGEGPAGD